VPYFFGFSKKKYLCLVLVNLILTSTCCLVYMFSQSLGNALSLLAGNQIRIPQISYRRRTLRSSKMPVETGTASLSRCSLPHISRGHASAPDDI